MSASEITSAFRRNVVVSASAGTGKTHLLCSLYVMLSLGLTSMGEAEEGRAHPPLPPRRIVATTFSRAAALEMRVRIEQALAALADGRADAPFALEIAERRARLAEPPSAAEIALRAKRAHAELGHHRIDTLHGLAGEIVRRHALAIGLPPGLAIGEEDELVEIQNRTIERVWSEAIAAGGTAELGARALLSALGDGELHRPTRALLDRLDESGFDAADLVTTDHARLREERRALAREAIAAFEDDAPCALLEARPAALALLDGLAPGPNQRIPPFEEALEHAALRALFAERRASKRPSAQPWFDFVDGLSGKTKEDKRYAFLGSLLEDRDLTEREGAAKELLARMSAELRRERLARGLLGFGDLLHYAQRGLRQDPELAQLVSEDIDALLVDEFQDSSRSQRDLVYLLRERPERRRLRRAGEQPGAADILGHGLFLVGDRKQSIYGFRGANVEIFAAMCAELAGLPATRALELDPALASAKPSADFVPLTESRRSAPAIVDFVNAFGVRDFESAGLVYAASEHLVATRSPAGQRVIVTRPDPEPLSDPLACAPGLRQAFTAAAVASELMRAATPIAPNAIAILTRKRATIGLVELALARLGLPFVVAGRALYDAREVRDLTALLRLVLDPRDPFSLAVTLRGPLVGLSDGALTELAGRSGRLGSALGSEPALDATLFGAEAQRLEDFRRRFRAARPLLLRESPGRALAAMVREFGLDQVLACQPRAAMRLANVERLVGIAEARGGTLFGFCRFIEQQIETDADEAEAVVFSEADEAVRLTTMHGAKGLTFDAAILLDLDAQTRGESASIGFEDTVPPRLFLAHKSRRGHPLPNPELDRIRRDAKERGERERRRLFYVAMTRPRKVLALVTASGPEEAPRAGSAERTLRAHHEALAPLFEEVGDRDLVERAIAASAPPAAPPAEAETRSTPRLALASELAVATTPLGVFAGCPRRFRLRFLLGFEEPVHSDQLELFEPAGDDQRPSEPDADPRTEGRAAHRVLELLDGERFARPPDAEELGGMLMREGLDEARARALAPRLAKTLETPFMRGLAHGATLLREHEFVLTLAGPPRLALRGTIDLAVVREAERRLDLVDYKLTAQDKPEAHRFQLLAYALALSERFAGFTISAGTIALLSGRGPAWLGGGSLDQGRLSEARGHLTRLARDLAAARASEHFPPVPARRCGELRCGFVTACHRKAR